MTFRLTVKAMDGSVSRSLTSECACGQRLVLRLTSRLCLALNAANLVKNSAFCGQQPDTPPNSHSSRASSHSLLFSSSRSVVEKSVNAPKEEREDGKLCRVSCPSTRYFKSSVSPSSSTCIGPMSVSKPDPTSIPLQTLALLRR